MAEQLIVLTGPLVVSAVIGVWVTLGRLYLARWGGPALPRWIAPVAGGLALLIGLVALATQLITASIGSGTGIAAAPSDQRIAAALLAVLLSPMWVLGASFAVLGIVTHYGLDRLLAWARINPILAEGLARGLRAVWAVLGVVAVGVGLQTTYRLTMLQQGSTMAAVLSGITPRQVLLSLAALGVALLGMLAPVLVANERRRAHHQPPAPDDAP